MAVNRKQIRKAQKHFEDETEKGQKKALSIMVNDGFDGVTYQKVFNVDLDGDFAGAAEPVTTESSVGKAKLLGASATDIPTVGIATLTSIMQSGGLLGIGVESSIYDIQKAFNAKNGKIAKEAETCYKYIEEAHHAIAWGTQEEYAKSNLLGFFTHPHVVRSQFDNGASGSAKFADKTAKEIIEDITGMVRDYYALNVHLREGQVEVKIYMPSTIFDILTMTKMNESSEKSILQHLKKFLPENGFDVKFEISSALATKDNNYVAIGDFRASTMSYEIPLVTEGMDTFMVGLSVRKDYIAESRGLTVTRENAAIIYEGA